MPHKSKKNNFYRHCATEIWTDEYTFQGRMIVRIFFNDNVAKRYWFENQRFQKKAEV
jgi:hypothetical protein